jgi:hypothetical protein
MHLHEHETQEEAAAPVPTLAERPEGEPGIAEWPKPLHPLQTAWEGGQLVPVATPPEQESGEVFSDKEIDRARDVVALIDFLILGEQNPLRIAIRASMLRNILAGESAQSQAELARQFNVSEASVSKLVKVVKPQIAQCLQVLFKLPSEPKLRF